MRSLRDIDALIGRAAAGDRGAFSPAFQRLWPIVLNFCYRTLGHHADAEDAAQRTMLELFAKAADYKVGRPVLPWVLAIASWECRTIRRRHSRSKEDPLSEYDRPVGGDEERFVHRDLLRIAVDTIGTLFKSDQDVLLVTIGARSASVSGSTLRKRRERAVLRLRSAVRRLVS